MKYGQEKEREEEGEEEVEDAPPPPVAPLQRLEVVGAVLPGRLLLVGAELEVLGGQFEAQGVGSQRVDHVLVAFSTVLHQERTPVRLRGADQLQTLQEERKHSGFIWAEQIHQVICAVGDGAQNYFL